MSKEKKKKEKVIYYDDNSTLVDMSSVTRGGKKQPSQENRRRSTFGEKWRTYWDAVKTMLIPTGFVLTVLLGLYLLIMLITGNLF